MPDPSSPRSNLSRGYSIAFIAAAVLSFTAIFIRYLTQNYDLPPLVLAFWRDTFVALTLLPLLLIFRPHLIHLERRYLLFLIGYGLILASFNSLWTLSVDLNGAAVSTVLSYSSAAFTALLGWWVLKERLDWVKLLAVLVSLAGCFLVANALDPAAWQSNLLGIVTGILSGLFYAFYSLMGRTASQRGLNPWTTLLYTFSFAAFFLLLINLLSGGALPGSAAKPADMFWLGNSVAGWGVLFLLAAGPSLAGYGLYNISLTLLPSSIANLILTSEPVFTAVIAYFVFHEILTPIQFVGGLLILVGVIFLRFYEERLAARSTSPLTNA